MIQKYIVAKARSREGVTTLINVRLMRLSKETVGGIAKDMTLKEY